MDKFWEELFKLLGLFAIFAYCLAWIVKTIITNALKKDIENYKNKLQTESQLKIENLKSQLQKSVDEYNIKLIKLHEKRAETIAELYRLFKDVELQTTLFVTSIEVSPMERKKGIAENVFQKWSELNELFEKSQLYFNKDLANQLKHFIRMKLDGTVIAQFIVHKDNPEELQNSLVKFADSWNDKTRELPDIYLKLEQEFRQMLGSSES